MNILAIITALIGTILMSLLVFFGNKIQNRWLRYITILIGLLLSLFIMGNIPSLLGDDSKETAGKAGTYLVFFIVTITIFKAIFFRKKSLK